MILDGIEIAEADNQRIYWSTADRIASELRDHLSGCPAIDRLEMAGSYRRGRETVGDLDILVVSTRASEVMDRLAAFPEREDVIARGETKMPILLASWLPVQLAVCPGEAWWAAASVVRVDCPVGRFTS